MCDYDHREICNSNNLYFLHFHFIRINCFCFSFFFLFLLTDSVLKYCGIPSTGTCCTYNMEMKLATASRTQLEKNTKESIVKLASVLGTRANKFNGKTQIFHFFHPNIDIFFTYASKLKFKHHYEVKDNINPSRIWQKKKNEKNEIISFVFIN